MTKFFWTTGDHINPLSPNGDQHQFSSNNIHTLPKEMVMRVNKNNDHYRENTLICYQTLPTEDQYGEFICGYWGLTG